MAINYTHTKRITKAQSDDAFRAILRSYIEQRSCTRSTPVHMRAGQAVNLTALSAQKFR